ncbi:MAG: GAF domain-containing SpoIIE family protein phosphatase [Rubricoccaceae bacterium]|nr:GAF domain-containing SpoIIE family protein phosphatase [Rubricoccaceae bacterium]
MSDQQANRFDLKSVIEASELLNTTLDLDFILSNLLLVAMSRLLVGRGVVMLADDDGEQAFRVVAAKGPAGVSPGDVFTLASPPEVAEGDALPSDLRVRGFGLMLPIRHQRKTVGLVALGQKATGDRFESTEVAFARSLVNMSASAIHSARVANQLQEVNLDLAARVQELNTLFELSQAFGSSIEKADSLKLLGFTLMGQMLVERYAVLLCDEHGGPFDLAVSHGLSPAFEVEPFASFRALGSPIRLPSNGTPGPDEMRTVLKTYDFSLAVPLRMADEMRGLVLLSPRVSGRDYSEGDATFVASLGSLALTSIENAELVESRIEKERLEEELRLARTIQERLLPTTFPEIEGFEIAALSIASRHVAGDYFDVLQLSSGKILFAIADVSGKGAPAALLMANLQAGLRLLRQDLDASGEDLAGATAKLNRVVCENTDPASFITFFWGILNPVTKTLNYVNAGHNPPRLARQDGELSTLDEGGLILGVLSDVKYKQGQISLSAGDALVLYTDGVTEARNPRMEEYEEKRLDAALKQSASSSARECLNTIREDVVAFSEGELMPDDLTLLVVKATA